MAAILLASLYAVGSYAGQVREYALTLEAAWLALDGNHRQVLTVNGSTPGPAIEVDEGDTLRVNVCNNGFSEATMHWHGIYQSSAYWNDGVPGVTQWPLEPRNCYTYEMKLQNQTGIYFYHGHFGPAFADGQRGPLWIRPAPDRPRPYSLISSGPEDLEAMMSAERRPRHVLVSDWNLDGMETLIPMYRDTGVEPTCAASIIFNNKGRTTCLSRDIIEKFDPKGPRDSHGCVPFPNEAKYTNHRDCQDTSSDLDVYEAAKGEKYMFLNFVHPGAGHELRVSVDEHDMWIVAADGDFVHPTKVQAINVNMGDRISVIVPLNQKPGDYAIRASSITWSQIIQGQSILRYHGVPESRQNGIMTAPSSRPHIDLVGDMVNGGRRMDELADLAAFPAMSPPVESHKTFRFVVNHTTPSTWVLASSPHQGFRQQMPPILWNKGSMGETTFGGIQNGSVVDIIYENAAVGDHPFHKHNHKAFIIGRGDGFFRWADVATALKESPESFNMVNPPFRDGARLAKEHGSWTVIRYTVTFPALSMLHCHKIAHFAAGQQIVLMEGPEAMAPLPEDIKSLTHADFIPPLRYGPLD
ncbi:putative multicopper oxidase, type 1 [Teratosphaeria nubilosa]|uniref:Putative multicopper oxidase, type 1 n=1 Tax=Teratosphaeria nubilosa TaxID=161662 RepID=A0A6G1KVF2_9PEZI|nr:putative multicopper oxidase, type 1 [Teratosphaeria nubilosa]